MLDFYHASGYVADVAKVIFPKQAECKPWLADRLHRLKHKRRWQQFCKRLINTGFRWLLETH